MIEKQGKLYVVATPIGNLADISFRALETLKLVDLIAAEDTRHVKILLQHYGIHTKVISFHQNNEDKMSDALLTKLMAGLSVALVSDAGTPLLNDPGLPLVRSAKDNNIVVIPIPGACAMVAALSAAGLPVTKFLFEGFLPRTSTSRQTLFMSRLKQVETLIFYESSHRIVAALQDMTLIFPPDRQVAIARELTKLHETIVKTTVGDVLNLVSTDANMQKGEFVVLLEGHKPSKQNDQLNPEQERILKALMASCSTKTAVDLAVEITGVRKKTLYQAALGLENIKAT